MGYSLDHARIRFILSLMAAFVIGTCCCFCTFIVALVVLGVLVYVVRGAFSLPVMLCVI